MNGIIVATGASHAEALGRYNMDGVIAASLMGRSHDDSAMDAYREQSHAQRFDSLMRSAPKFAIQFREEVGKELGIRLDSAGGIKRFDSWSPAAGLFQARQLEHVFARVLETPTAPLNGFTLFPINTEVAPGARTYTIRRFTDTGEAVIWRGGGNIPRVGMAQQEETRRVHHIASSFAYDIFDLMAANYANIGLVGGLLKACRKAIMQAANRLVWYGSTAADIYGVLTYKYLPKKSVSTPFDGTADPDDVIAELNAIVNYAAEQSDGTFMSDAILTSPEVKNYLMNTPRSSQSDVSIGKWWLDNNSAGITKIETAWEMKAGGSIPAGTHGILAYKQNDDDAIRHIVPQSFTTLPMQEIGLERVTIAYQSTGGVTMPNAGNNLLAFVTVAA